MADPIQQLPVIQVQAPTVGTGTDLGVVRTMVLTQDDAVEAVMAPIEMRTSIKIRATIDQVKKYATLISQDESKLAAVVDDATDPDFASKVDAYRDSLSATLEIPAVSKISAALNRQKRERTLKAAVALDPPDSKKDDPSAFAISARIEVSRVVPATPAQVELLDRIEENQEKKAAAEKEAQELKAQELYAIPQMRKAVKARYANHVMRNADGGPAALKAIVGENNELADLFQKLAPAITEGTEDLSGLVGLPGPGAENQGA